MNVNFYKPEQANEWNVFLSNCKGQTFMFNRNFMDYHSDRFIDRSIVVLDNNQIVALLPANLNNDKISISSHSGLTFGSFIVNEKIRTIKTIEYFHLVLKFLYDNNIQYLYFKQIPSFYCDISVDEIDYSFFLLEAELYRMDVSYVINNSKAIPFQERRVRNVKKGEANKIQIVESIEYTSFWNEILEPNLKRRFNVRPVHTLDEITKLSKDNLGSIKQYNAYFENKLVAGTTLFITPNVIHAQYISASEEGKKNGALDYLFHYLIQEYKNSKKYFDFGIVNENDGKYINRGLLDWKEGFGARAYAHRFYKIATDKFENLNIY
uniref:hypothetical protein n=1 Tax=Algoriphagus sp. TaxID=1872435 RepID=UPI004047DD70